MDWSRKYYDPVQSHTINHVFRETMSPTSPWELGMCDVRDDVEMDRKSLDWGRKESDGKLNICQDSGTCRVDDCHHSARSRGLIPAQGGGTRCRIGKCTKHVVSDGKCVSHGGGRRCRTANCSNNAVSRGLCILHGGGRQCQYNGCHKHVASGGLCRSHGGGRRCKINGCSSSAQSRGLCYVHGGGGRCQKPECTSSAKKGGYCIAHGGGHRCIVQDCKSSAVSGNLCRAHGGGKRCEIADCKSSAKTGGFCIAHGGGKRCSVNGCKSSAQRIGLCKAHGGGRKCDEQGCQNSAVSRGKCIGHGGGKRCALLGCRTTARKGGFCFAHGRMKHDGISVFENGIPRKENRTDARPTLPPIHEILRPEIRFQLYGKRMSPWKETFLPFLQDTMDQKYLRNESDALWQHLQNTVENVSREETKVRGTVKNAASGYRTPSFSIEDSRWNEQQGPMYGNICIDIRKVDSMEKEVRGNLGMLLSAVLCN